MTEKAAGIMFNSLLKTGGGIAIEAINRQGLRTGEGHVELVDTVYESLSQGRTILRRSDDFGRTDDVRHCDVSFLKVTRDPPS